MWFSSAIFLSGGLVPEQRARPAHRQERSQANTKSESNNSVGITWINRAPRTEHLWLEAALLLTGANLSYVSGLGPALDVLVTR